MVRQNKHVLVLQSVLATDKETTWVIRSEMLRRKWRQTASLQSIAEVEISYFIYFVKRRHPYHFTHLFPSSATLTLVINFKANSEQSFSFPKHSIPRLSARALIYACTPQTCKISQAGFALCRHFNHWYLLPYIWIRCQDIVTLSLFSEVEEAKFCRTSVTVHLSLCVWAQSISSASAQNIHSHSRELQENQVFFHWLTLGLKQYEQAFFLPEQVPAIHHILEVAACMNSKFHVFLCLLIKLYILITTFLHKYLETSLRSETMP